MAKLDPEEKERRAAVRAAATLERRIKREQEAETNKAAIVLAKREQRLKSQKAKNEAASRGGGKFSVWQGRRAFVAVTFDENEAAAELVRVAGADKCATLWMTTAGGTNVRICSVTSKRASGHIKFVEAVAAARST